MNNMFNSKLMQFLSGMDRNKLEEASKMIGSMSKDDINNLVSMLSNSMNNTNNNNNNKSN